MRKLYYFLWNFYLTSSFFVIGYFTKLMIKDPIRLRARNILNTHKISQKYIKSLRLATTVKNPERLKLLKQKNYLVVANHVSYTDIIVLSSLAPMVFITSVEMGNNPFLGTITRYGGSLFTDRKKFVSLPQEIKRFTQTAKDGFSIVLYAEGTSTDGTGIRDFRSSLFEIALQAGIDVLPICINYTTIDSVPRSDANKDKICWYGDMEFAPHFWELLGHSFDVTVEILEPIACATRMKRQELSDATYKSISEAYHV